jgi:hypothetical protein
MKYINKKISFELPPFLLFPDLVGPDKVLRQFLPEEELLQLLLKTFFSESWTWFS